MNNLEKHLLKHIVNAKLEPTRLQDVSKTDWQPNTDTENQAPETEIDWGKLLVNVLSAAFVPLMYLIIKSLISLRKQGDKCADTALRILKDSLGKRKLTGDPYDDAVNAFSILKDLVEKLDSDCKAKFLDMKEVKNVLNYIGGKIGATADELMDMLKTSGEAGMVAFATQLLKAGAQNAAIRVWAMANGANEALVMWLIGLGATAIIAIGIALGIGSGAIDLTGIGATVGIPAGALAALLIALGVWLKENQPSGNDQNTA